MGRVGDKQRALREAKYDAQSRIGEDLGYMRMMTPALQEQQYLDRLAAEWRGSSTVLAFLFAMPDEPTIISLNARGEYFNIRSGTTWDLFFPGYYRAADPSFENSIVGTRPVGDSFAKDWYFDASGFDRLRERVENFSKGRWEYSGGSDLVLINAYLPERGRPTIDWKSTQSGTIQPPETLAGVIERITRDLKGGTEDASYGVASITMRQADKAAGTAGATTREFFLQALAGIAAGLGAKAMGA